MCRSIIPCSSNADHAEWILWDRSYNYTVLILPVETVKQGDLLYIIRWGKKERYEAGRERTRAVSVGEMLFFKQERISRCSDFFFGERKINNGCFFERGLIIVALLIG